MFSRLMQAWQRLLHSHTLAPSAAPEIEAYVMSNIINFIQDPEVLAFLTLHSGDADRWASVHVGPGENRHNDKYLYLFWHSTARELMWYDFDLDRRMEFTKEQLDLERKISLLPGVSRGFSNEARYSYVDLNHVLVGDFLERLESDFGSSETLDRLIARYVVSFDARDGVVARLVARI